MDKPIPAFYACYLLRSTVRHASLYVGSTPNPVRRLRQHNGDAKGGAARTSRDSLRPWEMTCLVSGFPSKIAALQFEWAWQNTHLTRHVSPDSRLTQARMTVRYSPKTGRPRKRAQRPRMSLSDRLSNLHLLLRTTSFERWPLKVTFYAEDVFRVWQKCASHHLSEFRCPVVMDESSRTATGDVVQGLLPPSAKGIHAIDVTYAGLKSHLQKLRDSPGGQRQNCSVCHENLPKDMTMALICPKEQCKAVTHLQCLANAFLKDESSAESSLPISGECPECKSRLQWVDLVREMSLRMRAPKDVDKLFKVRKSRAKKADGIEEVVATDSEVEQDADGLPMDDGGWHELSSSDVENEDEIVSRDSAKASASTSNEQRMQLTPPSRIIEESDWEGAELVS